MGDRGISNIYMSDYDGARQQRVTISKSLDISPVWSPDSRSIAFASWRTGYQDIYVLYPYGGPELQNRRPGETRASRTTCRRGRLTVRSSPSRRRATASRKST